MTKTLPHGNKGLSQNITCKNSDSSVACQKFVQSILELPATDEIHMEDRKKV